MRQWSRWVVAVVVLAVAGGPAAADLPEFQGVGGLVDGGRDAHAAVLLSDGRVLVVGGWGGDHLSAKATAERFDPSTGSWSLTGALVTARVYHTANLLPDGRVLVAGGANGSPVFATTEIYDPGTGAFTVGAAMGVARQLHCAVTLGDGRILVVGGTSSSASPVALASAEIYDPSTGSWEAGLSMASGRNAAAAVLLQDGRVLIVGGAYGPEGGYAALAACEIFDPVTETFAATASMGTPRAYAGATLLGDGRVLVAGGSDGSTAWHTAEIYDPATGVWTPAGTTTSGGPTVTLTRLGDGRVLAAGGYDATVFVVEMDADLFDPVTDVFTPLEAMAVPRHSHSATRLLDGSVLLAGGAETLAPPGPYAGSTAEILASSEPPDSTPPVFSAVSDVHADATSALGAVVTFASPTATDGVDGVVAVTCTPASGSHFGVGVTEVTCSATDTSGNVGSVTFDVIVVIDARYLRSVVADRLSALVPSGSRRTDGLLLAAIQDIEQGLAPEYWSDDLHLSSKGRAAFREDSQAVKRLLRIEDPPAGVGEAVLDLLAADRALAERAIADATALNPGSPGLADAASEMDLAAEALDEGHFDAAIRHYRRAWRAAMKVSGLL